MQNIVNLVKGLSLYQIKNEELNQILYKFMFDNVDNFSIKQLEILLWSFSRKHLAHHPAARLKSTLDELPEYQSETLKKLIDKIKTKSPSMRARGIAFAIEAFSNLNYKDEELFNRMERVTLTKLDEFIPHYSVKVL